MMNEYKKELGWSVGRFVYQRGSSAPLHFMELQDFHVDSAQGMVETIVLRAIRTRLQSDLPAGKFFEDTKDTSWNHIAARIAAKIIMPDFQAGQLVRIVEIHSGIGVLFEALKLNLEHEGLQVFLDHIGIGTDEYRRQYEYIQSLDEHASRYLEEAEREDEIVRLCQRADLVVFNGAEALTHRGTQSIDLARIVAAMPKRLLVTSWVASNENETNRTTIKRRNVQLPIVSELCQILSPITEGTQPIGELTDGAFSDFFLPEPNYADGKIRFAIACAGSDVSPLVDLRSAPFEFKSDFNGHL